MSALDLYGDSSDGRVSIDNPSEEYSRVIGWTEDSGKNELDGGSVLAKNLSAYRIFGAEHHPAGSVESITVTSNSASVENVRQSTSQTMLYLGGADVTALASTTANIAAKLNSLTVTGTLSGIEGSSNSLSIFGAHVSSQVSDSSSEVIVQDNNIVLDGVKIQGWKAVGISGGNSYSKEATPTTLSGNKVEIVNSDIHATNYVLIEGASTNSDSPSQKVSGNIVSIRDSTITADSWLVVTGGATADYSEGKTEITGNQVQLHNSHIDGWVFGGSYNTTAQVNKGNSIKVSGVNSATSIHGFDTLYVELSDVNAENPVLTLEGSLDLTDRNLNISGTESFNVKEGTYSLISAPAITGISDKNITLESTWVSYDAKLSVETGDLDNLSLTTSAAKPTDNSKTLSESLLGTVAFLNQGAEFIADEGIAAIVNSAKLGEISTFGAIHGGSSNYKTGSRVDVDGYTLATGASLKVTSDWIVAGFIEAGWADSDSHIEGTKGEGDHDYYGLGLATRYMVSDAWYIDGSFRAGQASTEFTGLYAGDSAKYDSDAFYVTAHAGTGYVFKLTDNVNLDLYGRYLVTYLDGDEVSLHNKYSDKLNLDSTVTHAVRLGGRLTGSFCPYAGWKVGLAYEHVFDGDAESAVNSLNLEVPSLEGDIGIMEVGVSMKPSLDSRWSMDLGAKGYVGDREGVAGSLIIRYVF